jgi:trans-aconitate methyltransferase
MTATRAPTVDQWDDSAAAYDLHTRRFGTHYRIAALLGLLAPLAPRTVLDFGCGPGNSTRLLRRAFPTAAIAGIDSSPAMIHLARATTDAGMRITYHRTDLVTDDPPNDLGHRYDAVVCANSLFHVADKPALLRALTPLLDPGATIVFSLYDTVFQPANPLVWPLRDQHDDTLMDLLLDRLRSRGHHIHARREDREILTEATLTDLFTNAGFTVRCGAVLRLRRTAAERLSFFSVPATAAEVFPDVPADHVRDAADSLRTAAADLPAQERNVFAFTATRNEP